MWKGLVKLTDLRAHPDIKWEALSWLARVTHPGSLQFEILQHQLPQGCIGYVSMVPQEPAEL